MAEATQNKSREIITVNIGGFGVNIGQSSLAHLCAEYGLSSDGVQEREMKYGDTIHTSFEETSKGNYRARCLFYDLDPYPIHTMQNSYKYRNLVRDNYCITGKHGVNSNFAAGHYTIGKATIDRFNQKLRLLVEGCDELQGFIVNNSMSGGTGAGTGTLALERIAVDYRRKCKFGFHAFADDRRLSSPIQVYTALLSLHWLMDHTDISIILDNRKLYDICREKLNIKAPRYAHYNNICDKLISTVTAPVRFGLGMDLMSYSTDMVPFPRLHCLTPSLAPIRANNEKNYKADIQSLTDQSLDSAHFLQSLEDFDVQEDKYLSMSVFYRAEDIDQYLLDCTQSLRYMRTHRKATFVEWSSDSRASVHYIDAAPIALESDTVMTDDKQVVMLGNNTGIIRIFSQRISKKYDLLYSQRAYVHHMVGEGMEEGELAEARENLGFLEKDYLDVLAEQNWSDDDYDDEDTDYDENI
eukprot:614257_1